jgi:hypothetical protein
VCVRVNCAYERNRLFCSLIAQNYKGGGESITVHARERARRPSPLGGLVQVIGVIFESGNRSKWLCPRSATRSRSRLAVLHARSIYASSMMVLMDGNQQSYIIGWWAWLPHMLRPSGRMFQMQYSVYGALCWAIADWKAAAPRWLDIASWQKCLLRSSSWASRLSNSSSRMWDGQLGDAKLDTWSTVAQAMRAATRLMSVASAPLCVPTSATLRSLQVGGAGGTAVLAGAALNLASGAWFEAATIRMGVDSEHSSVVLSVLELLLGPEGIPGRFQTDNRNDPGATCANMLAEIMRTADAIANLSNTLHTRPAAIRASRMIVAFRSSMAPPPILVLPEPNQSGGFEYLSMLGFKGAELFAAQFAVGWRSYSAFSTALPGASDVQARTHLAGWLAAAKLGAVEEVSVTGLHAI